MPPETSPRSGTNKKFMNTNLNHSAETTNSATMKIATTVTETKSVEKEITLPYYFKNKYNQLHKLVTETHLVRVDHDKDWWGAKVLPASSFKSEIATGTPIGEFEFEAAYQKAMMYVDLICKNQEPSNEHDENEEIEMMIEEQMERGGER